MKSMLVAASLLIALPCGEARAGERFSIGIPAIPPVFLSVQEYVAVQEGFFKKYGIDPDVRPLENGGTTGKAAATGEVDLAASTTPIVISMVGNNAAPLVGIYGLENPDWLIGATDNTIRTCADLKGKAIGVDTLAGGRSAALQQMVSLPPCNLKMEDLQQVPTGAKLTDALITGQVKAAVLHLDDLAAIETTLGRPITTVITMKRVKPLSHYDLFVARADKIARDRDRYVRVLAAFIEAEAFMRNSMNWDRVAHAALPTGRTEAQAKEILKRYLEFEFWPNDHDGLDERRIESEIKAQVALGGLPAVKAPTYQSLVDRSIFRDAQLLVRKD